MHTPSLTALPLRRRCVRAPWSVCACVSPGAKWHVLVGCGHRPFGPPPGMKTVFEGWACLQPSPEAGGGCTAAGCLELCVSC